MTQHPLFSNWENLFARNFEKRPDLQNAAAVFEPEYKDVNDNFNAGVTCTFTLYAACQK